MDEVCAECGSKPDYRNVDVTTFDSAATEYQAVAWRCSNPSCQNHHPGNLSFDWIVTKGK